MNWHELNGSRQSLIQDVAADWMVLVKKGEPERVYHDFLKRHANLFFLKAHYTYFVISKLKLGSEFEVDFAIPEENHSRGLFWELIEIEKPQDAPYNKDGTPSAALTRATQQIRDWRAWLQDNRSAAQRLFRLRGYGIRSWRNPNFKFTIIIGTRQNSAKWLERRNQYASENAVEVRSFDYLADAVRERYFRDCARLGSGMWDADNPELSVRLANPFMEAITDSQWKGLLREAQVSSPHYISKISDSLDAVWKENTELREKFESLRAC